MPDIEAESDQREETETSWRVETQLLQRYKWHDSKYHTNSVFNKKQKKSFTFVTEIKMNISKDNENVIKIFFRRLQWPLRIVPALHLSPCHLSFLKPIHFYKLPHPEDNIYICNIMPGQIISLSQTGSHGTKQYIVNLSARYIGVDKLNKPYDEVLGAAQLIKHLKALKNM